MQLKNKVKAEQQKQQAERDLQLRRGDEQRQAILSRHRNLHFVRARLQEVNTAG